MKAEFASQDKNIWDKSKEGLKKTIGILAMVGILALAVKYVVSKAAITMPRIS